MLNTSQKQLMLLSE